MSIKASDNDITTQIIQRPVKDRASADAPILNTLDAIVPPAMMTRKTTKDHKLAPALKLLQAVIPTPWRVRELTIQVFDLAPRHGLGRHRAAVPVRGSIRGLQRRSHDLIRGQQHIRERD